MSRSQATACALIVALLNLSDAGIASPSMPAGTAPPAKTTKTWPRSVKGKVRTYATPIFDKLTDPLSDSMSSDALQMAQLLGILDKLYRLAALKGELVGTPGSHLSAEKREEMTDLKFDILETVEETRLQIDFVIAEIDEEQVILEEAERIFSEDRDNRVNRANQLAFRTNGALWAIAEAMDIPTYRTPRLSIPSGTVGIIAGIVPSLFSGHATRASSGGRYLRQIYPNILTKLYDIPTIPRVEYPDIVWQYLNAKPCGETRSRRELMREHWRDDSSIHAFKGGISENKLMLLTGNKPYTADLELISDKLIMMGQLKAVTLQMSRPLLEICMAVRGKKHFTEAIAP